MHVNMIIESKDATFLENVFLCNTLSESNSHKRPYDAKTSNHEIIDNKDINENEPRCSKRSRTSTSLGPDFLTYLLKNEPENFKGEMSSREASYWK